MQIKDFQISFSETVSCFNVVANSIGKLTLKILDANGFITKTINTQIDKGAQLLDINLNDLGNGTYIINAFNGDVFLKSFKLVR